PPVTDDLLKCILAMVVGADAIFLDGLLPGGLGLDVLPAIGELPGQLIAGRLALAALAAPGDALPHLDVVELIRQREALDAGGQAGDGLGVLERVQSVGAALFLLVLIAAAWAE